MEDSQFNIPKVSVVIPNYNHAPFLEKRINSVLRQTFQDLEIICLDDASTDNSIEVISRFADLPNFRFIPNQANSGSVFRQWNKGFREARGKYIWIAESDDYADERFLETLIAALEANPSVGVAYCQSWVIDENDVRKFIIEHQREHIDRNRWLSSFINTGQDECSRYFILGCMINNASSALVRRSVVESIGYADENWRIAGDWIFWAKMLLASDIAFVAEPLNFWRQHSGTVRSSTSRNGRMIQESYDASRYISERTQIPEDILEKARSIRFHSWVCYNEDCFFSFTDNKRIYFAARMFDPHINTRLLCYLPAFPARTIGRRVKRLIKQAGRR